VLLKTPQQKILKTKLNQWKMMNWNKKIIKNLSFFTFKAQINGKVSDFRNPESTITQLSHYS
jgi:pterin-4a-carbinolamine dehydratase